MSSAIICQNTDPQRYTLLPKQMDSLGKLSESSSSLTPTADSLSPHASEHTNICNSCGSNTGLERLDASKLNQLLDHVRTRLSSDFYGNLFIEGGNLAKDKRHGDLGELFNLMAKLDSFKASMDKYIELHMPKEAPKPEKPGKLNENTSAMVRNIVEAQVEARFRDVNIRCDRLEEQSKNNQPVGNARNGNAKQANSIKIVELEKKADDIKRAAADQSDAVLRYTVNIDEACRAKNAANTEEFASLWTRNHVMKNKVNELRAERSDLQGQIDDNAKDIERVTRDLAELEEIILGTNAQMARLMHRMDRMDRKN
ncbi:hypothetical protein KC332_g10188 [Hortaea werneckii]|nr:hypothetical protein KC358_g10074 [Hortaea werneckii]KAI6822978.1 hypothetical protein KC350_g9290 [Hortaea werneckii]KAI6916604.1 hypothetical protein KC348_g11478 [Hortaea werneckii]KAI6931134.1 hypothetical protein KC341_g9792 [Hortaea werneckii]KAI6956981.1 hypothetical protein KC329_g18117 [Hortaea werneckii]